MFFASSCFDVVSFPVLKQTLRKFPKIKKAAISAGFGMSTIILLQQNFQSSPRAA